MASDIPSVSQSVVVEAIEQIRGLVAKTKMRVDELRRVAHFETRSQARANAAPTRVFAGPNMQIAQPLVLGNPPDHM